MDLNEVIALLGAVQQKSGEGNMRFKAPASTDTSNGIYVPGGLFTTYGLENDVVSTHVTPRGIGSVAPAVPGNIDDPRFPFLLGWADDYGSEQDGPCDDAPKTYMKGGTLTAQWGRITRQTETIEITSQLHMQRGVNTNLRLLGEMMGMDTLVNNDFPANPLDVTVAAEMVGVGVSLERALARMTWTGSPANNTAGGGYAEFPGLDNQIATGHVDAVSNTAMPAADSLIMEYGYNYVDGAVLDIVEYLSAMEYYMFRLADTTRLAPVTWAVCMRPELWQYVSMVWPCRYLTNRCTTASNSNPMVINDDANVRMRDQMRQGSYIDINGRRYPVISDDGIFEHTNANNANVPAGSFASSIYFVPLRVRSSFSTLYWEYIDYRQVRTQLAPMGRGAGLTPFWSDSGRFIWALDAVKTCFDLAATIEPRLVLRTPQLAAKLQHVMYTPLEHLRSFDPQSPYWLDGGVSTRSLPTSYAVWA